MSGPAIAGGALGYEITKDVLNQTTDIKIQLDKWAGIKFPNDDIDTYKDTHVYDWQDQKFKIAIWQGTDEERKAGILYDLIFQHDGYSIGSIVIGLDDIYDWPAWSGDVTVSIVPIAGASDNGSALVSIMNNLSWNNVVETGAGHLLFTIDGTRRIFVKEAVGLYYETI
jgi:hypothetical protein